MCVCVCVCVCVCSQSWSKDEETVLKEAVEEVLNETGRIVWAQVRQASIRIRVYSDPAIVKNCFLRCRHV